MPFAGSTSAAILEARTQFEQMFEDVLAGTPAGVVSLMMESVPLTGQQLNLIGFSNFPRPRVWDGSREFSGMRGQGVSIPLTTWQAAVPIKRTDLKFTGGLDIDRLFADFFSTAQTWLDDLFLSALKDNTLLCYDGQPVISASHPNAGSGGGDNLNENAFSTVQLNATIARMRGRTDESGRPLGVRPSHILCGPSMEEEVLSITGAERAVFVDASGNVNAGGTPSAGGGVTLTDNARPGRLTPVVSEYLSDTDFVWVMDLTKRSKPLVHGDGGTPEQDIVDDDTDGLVFTTDEYLFGIKMDGALAAGPWQLIERIGA